MDITGVTSIINSIISIKIGEKDPYNFYSDFEQIKDKIKDIFLLLQDEIIVGSVACYGKEIDDLVVNKKYQN